MKKIFFSRYPVLIIVVGLFLFGCATAEYRLVKGECSSQAFQQYPVNNHIEVVDRVKQVRVPIGQTCTQMGSFQNCTTNYSYENQIYQKQVNVDSNAGARSQAIRSCTTSLCFSRYGNAKCKTAPVKPAQ